MIKAYRSFWKNYVNFQGRTSRGGYWYTVLCNVIVSLIIYALAFVAGIMRSGGLAMVASILSIGYMVAVAIPTIAISVRRLHDIGKSGFWYFIMFVPCIGSIVFLIFMCMPSVPGANEYGAQGVDLMEE